MAKLANVIPLVSVQTRAQDTAHEIADTLAILSQYRNILAALDDEAAVDPSDIDYVVQHLVDTRRACEKLSRLIADKLAFA
jgi:hypothetical protein